LKAIAPTPRVREEVFQKEDHHARLEGHAFAGDECVGVDAWPVWRVCVSGAGCRGVKAYSGMCSFSCTTKRHIFHD
jgi:hypothetical protein